jgi:hypothetical protein
VLTLAAALPEELARGVLAAGADGALHLVAPAWRIAGMEAVAGLLAAGGRTGFQAVAGCAGGLPGLVMALPSERRAAAGFLLGARPAERPDPSQAVGPNPHQPGHGKLEAPNGHTLTWLSPQVAITSSHLRLPGSRDRRAFPTRPAIRHPCLPPISAAGWESGANGLTVFQSVRLVRE